MLASALADALLVALGNEGEALAGLGDRAGDGEAADDDTGDDDAHKKHVADHVAQKLEQDKRDGPADIASRELRHRGLEDDAGGRGGARVVEREHR